MGQRKKLAADAAKEAKKITYFAKLNNCPTSPRKMRLVADLVRGMEVNKALGVLQFTPKEAATKLETLLKSAMHNFEQKTGAAVSEGELKVSSIPSTLARSNKKPLSNPKIL